MTQTKYSLKQSNIIPQMEEFLTNTSNSEKALEFTVNLAASVETENVMSEQDLFQSTKLMDAASKAKPKNSTEATSIIRVINQLYLQSVISNKNEYFNHWTL
jgi:hypothetical protein